MKLSVRELQLIDIEKIVDYFVYADAEYLKGMGADRSKLPNKQEWVEKLKLNFEKSYSQKEFYYIIWLLDNEPIGHSNVNNINFEESAKMHLHLWQNNNRKSGLGFEFLKLTIPYFFENLRLQKLICEPFSENIAPNKILAKIGFELVRTYETIPGYINLLQIVNRYELVKSQVGLINKDMQR